MTTTDKCCHSLGRWTVLAIVLVLALGIFGWATMEQRKNIMKTASELGDCKTFVECVNKAGLGGVLEKDGPFSIFVPTDAAFAKLSKEQLSNLLNNKSALTALLLYHMVPKRLTPDEMENLKSVMTCTVPQSGIACSQGKFGDGNCLQAAIPCTNGVIFLIDAVQTPPFMNENPTEVEEASVTIVETGNGNGTAANKKATPPAKPASDDKSTSAPKAEAVSQSVAKPVTPAESKPATTAESKPAATPSPAK